MRSPNFQRALEFVTYVLILESRISPICSVNITVELYGKQLNIDLLPSPRQLMLDLMDEIQEQLSGSAGCSPPSRLQECFEERSRVSVVSVEWHRTYCLECDDRITVDSLYGDTASTLARLTRIKELIAADPNTPISQLDINLSGEWAEVQKLLTPREIDLAIQCDLMALFEARVRQDAERTAIFDGDRETTFAELGTLVERAAVNLRRKGVREGDVVGVCAARSTELVVAVLAVLHVGACYLPLDPQLPVNRLQLLIKKASAKAVILLDRSIILDAAQIIDDASFATNDGPLHPFASAQRSPLSSCYIIFSSGSTGEPKGVVIPDEQVLNRFQWFWKTFPFDREDIFACKSAIGFVDSVWELVGPLLGGCPIAIFSNDEATDPRQFCRAIERYAVSRIWLVPTLLKRLLELDDAHRRRLRSVNHWVSTGEPLLPGVKKRFLERLPHSKLHNLYGSSEFGDTCWDFPSHGPHGENAARIGNPIDNVQCIILDRFDNICPIGVWGQLHVAPVGLPVYLSDRSKSYSAPFTKVELPQQGQIPFGRTGDVCRWLRDGSLELLGRMDLQVKVRGARVNCLEVESALLEDPKIKEAVVFPAHDRLGDVCLFSVITVPEEKAEHDEKLLKREIRQMLKSNLPSYFLPQKIIISKSLPKTSTGKLNRRMIVEKYSE